MFGSGPIVDGAFDRALDVCRIGTCLRSSGILSRKQKGRVASTFKIELSHATIYKVVKVWFQRRIMSKVIVY